MNLPIFRSPQSSGWAKGISSWWIVPLVNNRGNGQFPVHSWFSDENLMIFESIPLRCPTTRGPDRGISIMIYWLIPPLILHIKGFRSRCSQRNPEFPSFTTPSAVASYAALGHAGELQATLQVVRMAREAGPFGMPQRWLGAKDINKWSSKMLRTE